jgi:hypothetical protein
MRSLLQFKPFTACMVGLFVWSAFNGPLQAGCSRFGTAIDFAPTPAEAARQAAREEKLVLVLHLSGHFENSKFT